MSIITEQHSQVREAGLDPQRAVGVLPTAA